MTRVTSLQGRVSVPFLLVLIHDLVKKPLTFTVQALLHYRMTSRISFVRLKLTKACRW